MSAPWWAKMDTGQVWKGLENRERFIEYSTLPGATWAGFSNSGLDWVTGQAYIKGLAYPTF